VLDEGGEEERAIVAFEEDLSRHPEAGGGTEERDVRGVAPHRPAVHEPVRPRRAVPQAELLRVSRVVGTAISRTI
jgi:hypothetical protein